MSIKKKITTSLVVLSLGVGSMASQAHAADGKATLMTLLGAAGGAALGSNVGKGKGNIAAIAVGTLLGASVGRGLGKGMTGTDQASYQRVQYNSLEYTPTGQTTVWNNPDSGSNAYFVPTATFQESGRYCREFTQTISVGSQSQSGYGKACRQPDGSWQIIGM